jgi:hypothetical protein
VHVGQQQARARGGGGGLTAAGFPGRLLCQRPRAPPPGSRLPGAC